MSLPSGQLREFQEALALCSERFNTKEAGKLSSVLCTIHENSENGNHREELKLKRKKK
jgi:hypothetical protein